MNHFQLIVTTRIATEKQRVQAEHDRIREEAAAKARQDLIDEQNTRQAQQQSSAAPASAPAAAPASAAPAQFTPVAAAPLKVNPVPPAANDDAVINVGEINKRIDPLQISAAGLQELGFTPVPRKGAAVYFRESDWTAICEALIQHLTQVADLQVA